MNLVQTELGLQVRDGGIPVDREYREPEGEFSMAVSLARGFQPSGDDYLDAVRRRRLQYYCGGWED